MPSPKKPSAEGEKALEAESDASFARELKGKGANGVAFALFDEEEDEGARAEGAGRRMEAGRTKGTVG